MVREDVMECWIERFSDMAKVSKRCTEITGLEIRKKGRLRRKGD